VEDKINQLSSVEKYNSNKVIIFDIERKNYTY
jgi:hypothetical protein